MSCTAGSPPIRTFTVADLQPHLAIPSLFPLILILYYGVGWGRTWRWYENALVQKLVKSFCVTCPNNQDMGHDPKNLIYPAAPEARGMRSERGIVECPDCGEELCYDPPIAPNLMGSASPSALAFPPNRLAAGGAAVLHGCGRRSHEPLSCLAAKLLTQRVQAVEEEVTRRQCEMIRLRETAAEQATRTRQNEEEDRHRRLNLRRMAAEFAHEDMYLFGQDGVGS